MCITQLRIVMYIGQLALFLKKTAQDQIKESETDKNVDEKGNLCFYMYIS